MSDSRAAWEGELTGVQPRIRLTRSFDQRTHSYLGYLLRLRGEAAGEPGEFAVAVGKGAHEKFAFQAGDLVRGLARPVADPRLEIADYYRASGIEIVARGVHAVGAKPPFFGVAPPLPVYRERGHRRLAARTFAAKCGACIWACEMAVEMIVDHWNPSRKRYRRETFCYGPKSCLYYKSGPTRKVPGRGGMSWEEEDWVDEDATAHRGPDD
jgi:hypothetical protein